MFSGASGVNRSNVTVGTHAVGAEPMPHLNINGVKILASADKMPSRGTIGLHFDEPTHTLTVKLYTSSTFDTVEKFEIRTPELFAAVKQAVGGGIKGHIRAALLAVRSEHPGMPQFILNEDDEQFKIIAVPAAAVTSSKLNSVERLIDRINSCDVSANEALQRSRGLGVFAKASTSSVSEIGEEYGEQIRRLVPEGKLAFLKEAALTRRPAQLLELAQMIGLEID